MYNNVNTHGYVKKQNRISSHLTCRAEKRKEKVEETMRPEVHTNILAANAETQALLVPVVPAPSLL